MISFIIKKKIKLPEISLLILKEYFDRKLFQFSKNNIITKKNYLFDLKKKKNYNEFIKFTSAKITATIILHITYNFFK
jgi:hypothetical protein